MVQLPLNTFTFGLKTSRAFTNKFKVHVYRQTTNSTSVIPRYCTFFTATSLHDKREAVEGKNRNVLHCTTLHCYSVLGKA